MFFDPVIGPKHQELQVPKMAVSTKLQQPLQTAFDWNPLTEQLNGTLVVDALLNATCFPVTQRLQGMVF